MTCDVSYGVDRFSSHRRNAHERAVDSAKVSAEWERWLVHPHNLLASWPLQSDQVL